MVKFAQKIIIIGTIQEMFFNGFVKENADKLKIGGYIRKKEDGNIEILLEGNKADVLNLIKIIKKTPKYVQIRDFKIEDKRWSGEFKEFKILRI